jgi:hypothetical protein
MRQWSPIRQLVVLRLENGWVDSTLLKSGKFVGELTEDDQRKREKDSRADRTDQRDAVQDPSHTVSVAENSLFLSVVHRLSRGVGLTM